MSDQYWHMSGFSGLIARATIRTLQFVFAVIVAALYGVDLQHATKTHTQANSAWIYAEVVAGLSILTCAVHCLVTVKRVAWCAWDWVLFLLWVSQFGVFGMIYIGGQNTTDEDATESVARMNVAVWIDFVNMLLWFATAVGGIVWCCTARRGTRRTDRVVLGEETRETRDAFVHPNVCLPGEADENFVEREFKMSDGESEESTLKADDDKSMKSRKSLR